MTVYLPAVPGYSLLADTGVAATDVVHVTEYVASADLSLDAERAAFLGDHVVPISRVPVEAIYGSDASYAVAVTAHPGGGTLLTDGDDVLRVADGVVYLPSVHTVSGDFRDQYRWCLTRIAELLAVAGLDMTSLVRTVDYTATATRAEYPRCGRPRKELLPGPVHPGAAGILVDVPVARGAQVSLDAIAASGPLTVLNPGWARYDTLTYKPAVRAGDTIYLAGFGALDPVSQLALHDGDLVAQTEFIYASIETVLASGGATGSDVTALVEYLTPAAVAAYPSTRALREKHFPNAAVTSVVCSALLRPEFLLETVPTAVVS
ncbi:enamine deaminase RidA (YjgF/YER057c/UK114 family) [Actinoplanes lutulentus]|uniref:Enamine deaminase RidA (YjgF/YER057c/UK114 family) n=1 Tax=Actinoplanes lutulentus TaxID=1287878 RepID=A0A327ZI45_9ACTN|nr:Rid family hydrolase [Actinoplanes lutulentus]MBB2944385.1 enamine deaminase RidA (YjgF/YER057c/UK114 family) [Actinoplanes lutulentus]RAK42383.1 enamine deaminase RidA (YjgF/YER057c/UK114 family) [Actinoplanes lutulentus]